MISNTGILLFFVAQIFSSVSGTCDISNYRPCMEKRDAIIEAEKEENADDICAFWKDFMRCNDNFIDDCVKDEDKKMYEDMKRESAPVGRTCSSIDRRDRILKESARMVNRAHILMHFILAKYISGCSGLTYHYKICSKSLDNILGSSPVSGEETCQVLKDLESCSYNYLEYCYTSADKSNITQFTNALKTIVDHTCSNGNKSVAVNQPLWLILLLLYPVLKIF